MDANLTQQATPVHLPALRGVALPSYSLSSDGNDYGILHYHPLLLPPPQLLLCYYFYCYHYYYHHHYYHYCSYYYLSATSIIADNFTFQ